MMTKKFIKYGLKEGCLAENGFSLNYYEGGTGDTLMLLHGFGGDGQLTWNKSVKELSKSNYLIVPDLLWFGKSTSNKTPNLETQVDALNALIVSKRINTYNLVGISYGGFVALELADRTKNQIEHLVIVDSPGMTYDVSLLDSLCHKSNVESVDELFVPKTHSDVKRLLDFSFYKSRFIPKFVLKDLYNVYFSSNHSQLTTLINSLSQSKINFKYTNDSSGLKLSVIWGQYDEVFPVSEGVKLANHLNCELHLINKSGHAPNIEKSKEFNALLNTLLVE